MRISNYWELDVRQLQLVSAVAESGNLTAAASQLHLTQSALSHRLKALEAWTGTPVFHRVGRTMVLTQAGQRLLQGADRILGELSSVRDEIDQLVAGHHGRVRLATECYTAYHWLPRILPDFRQEFPHVDVQIEPNTDQDLMAKLRAGQLDLAIISHTPPAAGVETSPLFSDHLCAVVAPGHRWSGRQCISRRELAEEHLLVYSGVADKKVEMLFGDLDVSPAKVTELQLTEAILEWVAADLGITVLPRWAVGRYYSSGAVALLPVDCATMQRTWFAATLGNERPKYLQHLIDLIVERPPTEL